MNVALKSGFDTGADRRAFGRRETHMPASVRLPNHTLYDCVIRDISEGGALLEFPQRIDISGRLRLCFENGNQEIICDVRHVREQLVGVQFARNISLAARPVAEPAAEPAPSLLRREDAGSGNVRISAATELVALRRNARKLTTSIRSLADALDTASVIVELPIAADERVMPRDISSLLQSVAALAAERAVPRPLPARAYATALVIEPDNVPELALPRDMSSLLFSVRLLATARAVTRPLPASAYAMTSG